MKNTIKQPVKLSAQGLSHAIEAHIKCYSIDNLARLNADAIANDIIDIIKYSDSLEYEIKSHETKDGNPRTIRFDVSDFHWEEIEIEEEEGI